MSRVHQDIREIIPRVYKARDLNHHAFGVPGGITFHQLQIINQQDNPHLYQLTDTAVENSDSSFHNEAEQSEAEAEESEEHSLYQSQH